jgi:hypothetical protein
MISSAALSVNTGSDPGDPESTNVGGALRKRRQLSVGRPAEHQCLIVHCPEVHTRAVPVFV